MRNLSVVTAIVVLFGGIAIALVAAANAASAATAIGKVTRIQGDATGTVEGVRHAIAGEDAVYLDEGVTTGIDARLELTLDDATVLTVGENASLRLDAFIYRPDANVVKVTLAGAFRFVSGKLSAGSARDATVTTPFAVIAIRGTDFWGGPIDGAFGVLLFEGAVAVTNAGATTDLAAPGDGVNLPTAVSPPGGVVAWAADKVARAVATVTFR
jgi:hypothetical protein